MNALKITNARAAALAALDEAATPAWIVDSLARILAYYGVSCTGVRATHLPDESLAVAARNALRDFQADRRTLLDALRQAEELLTAHDCGHPGIRMGIGGPVLADLRALLASAEGGNDGE